MATADSHPQPKTMAPSKNDVVQNLMYYFGAPVSPEKLKDYSEHHAQTYHFPDAFVGSNVKIRDTLNNLIVKVCPCPSTCMCTTRVSPVPPLRFCLAVATELADVGRSALFPDRGRRRRVGRDPVRCSPDAARAGTLPSVGPAVCEYGADSSPPVVRSTKASAVARLRCAGTHRLTTL